MFWLGLAKLSRTRNRGLFFQMLYATLHLVKITLLVIGNFRLQFFNFVSEGGFDGF